MPATKRFESARAWREYFVRIVDAKDDEPLSWSTRCEGVITSGKKGDASPTATSTTEVAAWQNTIFALEERIERDGKRGGPWQEIVGPTATDAMWHALEQRDLAGFERALAKRACDVAAQDFRLRTPFDDAARLLGKDRGFFVALLPRLKSISLRQMNLLVRALREQDVPGGVEILEQAIAAGAPVDGWFASESPLTCAIGSRALLETLVAAGADIDAKPASGCYSFFDQALTLRPTFSWEKGRETRRMQRGCTDPAELHYVRSLFALVGKDATFIAPFLRRWKKHSYPINHYVSLRCSCGTDEFAVRADPQEGACETKCVACKRTRFVADSEQYAGQATMKGVRCECKAQRFQVGVGFWRDTKKEVRWIFVGARCVACDLLRAVADWKIDYTPSRHLVQLDD